MKLYSADLDNGITEKEINFDAEFNYHGDMKKAFSIVQETNEYIFVVEDYGPGAVAIEYYKTKYFAAKELERLKLKSIRELEAKIERIKNL